MDILIKSFNRAYFLNRCLQSIYKHLENFKGKIYVLDDGTPKIYLDKIQSKYPDTILLKSESYDLKSKLLESHNYHLPNSIPSKLWYESALHISDFFIVLEDDIWFTKTTDASKLYETCKKENLTLLKLFWLKNSNLIGKVSIKNTNNITVYQPIIHYKNPVFFKYVFSKHNKLWKKILTRLGFFSKEKDLNYYSIYSVAGAVFKKDYYLNIWKNADAVVHEKQQMINAITYTNKNQVSFGRTHEEVVKTTFLSSAFIKEVFSEFSIHNFNFILNESFLKNDNLFCNHLEKDLNTDDIIAILKLNNKSNIYISQWQNWANHFKKNYQDIGCNI